jgi:2,3-bisphosphoglycerate-independent phosphoglycerate mutase
MKFAVLVGDGMADWPLENWGGKTPLELAHTPWMDFLAQRGKVGRVLTVPEDLPPDSSIANLSLLGYDPRKFFPGRGPLEASSRGIILQEGQWAFRCNLVSLSEDGKRLIDYSGGHISSEEARELFSMLEQKLGGGRFRFYPGVSFRGLLLVNSLDGEVLTTPPHDIMGMEIEPFLPKGKGSEALRELMERAKELLKGHPLNRKRIQGGKLPANGIWPWGGGKRPSMPSFKERFHLSGAVVAGVDLIRGIGILLGMEAPLVEGATGFLDTNYRGKAQMALQCLKKVDFVYLHVEAPDEASHMGSLEEKIRAIERFDQEVVGPVFEGLKQMKEDFRLLVATDHPTPLSQRTHVREAVPFVIYDPRKEEGGFPSFSEREAQKGLLIEEGHRLLDYFLKG